MVTKMSHTTLFVSDQQKAFDFYVTKLGFRVQMDSQMDNGFRWLTVSPPDQADLQITLINPLAGEMNKDEKVRNAFQVLLDNNALGAGVFYTPDCKSTYDELKNNGVLFKSPPKQQFYGLEAILTDECGNWFSMTGPKEA